MEPRLRPPRITQPRAEQHGDADVKGRKLQAFGNAQFPVLLVEDSKVECGERNHEGEERQPEPGGRPKPVSKQEFHRLSVLWRRKQPRSEEHTSELQSLMRISYVVFCLNKKKYT